MIIKYLKKENIKKTISFFLLGVFVSEILSYGNYFAIWEIGKGNSSNPTVFMYHTFYSIFLAIAASIVVIKILVTKILIQRMIYLLFLLTISLNMLFNVGRTGQISFLLTILLICMIHYKNKVRYFFLIAFLMTTTIALNYQFNSTFQERVNFIKSDIENITKEDNFNTSIGARLGFWLITNDIITESNKNLFLGLGAKQNIKEAKIIVDTKYPELYYNKTLHSFHNIYLSIITQFGLIGLILFLILIYSLLRIKIIDYEIRLIKYSLISVFLLSALVEMSFYKNFTLSLFSLFLGIILSQSKFEKKKMS